MEKIKGAYIFYIFNTLTDRHIDLALSSIANQQFDIDIFDFIVYNNSNTFDTQDIVNRATEICGSKFRYIIKYVGAYPQTNRTLDDINHQIITITGYDFYFCHKADFALNIETINNILKTNSLFEDPYFFGLSKFDLREYVSDEEVNELLNMDFDEIIDTGFAADLTGDVDSSLKEYHRYIGYRGWDGTLHFYNDKARKVLELDSYIQPYTIEHHQKNKGLLWYYGVKHLLALHIFHELPGGRNADKDVIGHRF